MEKNIKKNIKEKSYKIFRWIKRQCKDIKTLIIFLIVIIVMYMPVWGGYLLYWIFRYKWFLTIATITMTFWIGPFTPFFPLAITITLCIKRYLQVKKRKDNTKKVSIRK